MAERCADCGVDIVEFPTGSNRWAELSVTSDGLTESRSYAFCCRVVYDTSHGEPYRVERADYHHPPSRQQRHFIHPEGAA